MRLAGPREVDYLSRLYRSRNNRVIAGVAGGLGEYFDVDPVIVRLLFVLLSFAGGNGLLVYIVAWILIPERPRVTMQEPSYSQAGDVPYGSEEPPRFGNGSDYVESSTTTNGDRYRLLGAILLIVGLVLLAERTSRWFNLAWLDPAWLLPIGLIVAGFAVLVKGRR